MHFSRSVQQLNKNVKSTKFLGEKAPKTLKKKERPMKALDKCVTFLFREDIGQLVLELGKAFQNEVLK